MTGISVDLFYRGGKSTGIKYNEADSIQTCFYFFVKYLFFPSFSVSCLVVHATHDIECETFMKFPFMLTRSYVFIIYVASKRNGTAIQFSVSTSICSEATHYSVFKRTGSLDVVSRAIACKEKRH